MSQHAVSLGSSHRYARPHHLAALGIGAVIGGDFFGWQAIVTGGFGGAICVFVPISVMYLLLSYSLAELSAAIPAPGGPYVFAQVTLGSQWAFVAGLAETSKIILTLAVIAVGITDYLESNFHLSEAWSPLIWFIIHHGFAILNSLGVKASFMITLTATVASLVLLAIFWIGAIPVLDFQKYAIKDGWFTGSIGDVVKGVPACLWLYLGIEEVPLAVEEAIEPIKSIPRGLGLGFATLVVVSILTVTINCSVYPGAAALIDSEAPLLEGYRAAFGDNSFTQAAGFFLITGLMTGFHSFDFCMGTIISAIAEDGYFPRRLAARHPTRETPVCALFTGAMLSFLITVAIRLFAGKSLTGILMSMALIGAMISYALQMASFLCLRKQKNIPTPYKSPFGVFGAILTLLLVAMVLASIFFIAFEQKEYWFGIALEGSWLLICTTVYMAYPHDDAELSNSLLEEPRIPINAPEAP